MSAGSAYRSKGLGLAVLVATHCCALIGGGSRTLVASLLLLTTAGAVVGGIGGRGLGTRGELTRLLTRPAGSRFSVWTGLSTLIGGTCSGVLLLGEMKRRIQIKFRINV